MHCTVTHDRGLLKNLVVDDWSISIHSATWCCCSVDQASMFLSVIYLLKQNINFDEVVNIFSLENMYIF